MLEMLRITRHSYNADKKQREILQENGIAIRTIAPLRA